MIFSIGLRPCTGAILVLFFANLAGTFWLGVISALIMAVGTAITTSSIALLTVSGRKIVQHYLNSEFNGQYIGLIFRGFAGLILIVMAIILYQQGGFGMSPMLN